MKRRNLIALIILPFLCALFQTHIFADEWTQFAHDARRTSYNPQSLGNDWQVKWIWNYTPEDARCKNVYIDVFNGCRTNIEYGTGSHTCLSQSVEPITGNGRVHIGTIGGKIIALNGESGLEDWSFDTENNSPVEHTGAYDNSTKSVYFASRNGWIYRLNSSNGQEQQKKRLDGEILAAPLLVDNKIFIGTNTGHFYSLNKTTLNINWEVTLPSGIVAPAAYSERRSLVIVEAENMKVYALNTADGTQAWNTQINGDTFCHSYPVVSDIHDLVFVVSHLPQSCNTLWTAAPSTSVDTTTTSQIRNWIDSNGEYQSYFAFQLSNGAEPYTVPILFGGHELHFDHAGCEDSLAENYPYPRETRDVMPPPVLRQISNSEEVGYVPLRSKQSCRDVQPGAGCDARDDATLGEMNLSTGNIRFINPFGPLIAPTNRVISDEFDFMSMAGDVLFHNNWQALGAIKITDRSPDKGGTFNNPIVTQGVYTILNSNFSDDSCANNASHYCPSSRNAPPDCHTCDSTRYYSKGFFVYKSDRYNSVEQEMNRDIHSPISNGVIYYRTDDGTIMAIDTGAEPETPLVCPADAPFTTFPNSCRDSCWYLKNPELTCAQTESGGCDCGLDNCWNGFVCNANNANLSYGIEELIELVKNWGTEGPIGDIDPNGAVDINDLIILVRFWG